MSRPSAPNRVGARSQDAEHRRRDKAAVETKAARAARAANASDYARESGVRILRKTAAYSPLVLRSLIPLLIV